MIDLLIEHSGGETTEPELLRALAAHMTEVERSARGGDRRQVAEAEAAARADPGRAFTFDASGAATLSVGGRTWHAGTFETPAIGLLRSRVTAARGAAVGASARVRLYVLDGAHLATDIGSLQAHAGSDTLFQVASQFNCLEAPGPYVTPVQQYFNDPTQGPRASISAFPGTLLRHYAAPGKHGRRFVQTTDGNQLDLLAAVCEPGVARVRNGYLVAAGIADPEAFAAGLEARLDSIRVGVHAGIEIVLGVDWDGSVSGPEPRRITQVFTSTVAGGLHGTRAGGPFEAICRQLLRAAYLGTLLAAVSLGQTRVVLTLIGGGVFRNPIPLIWDAIQWALGQIEPLVVGDLDVVVNGRNLGVEIDLPTILGAVRAREGILVSWRPNGVTIHR